MSINITEVPVDPAIQQKKQGFATPRKIRATKLNKGNFFAGWEAISNGVYVSPQNAEGFRIRFDSVNQTISFDGGVSIRNTGVPVSDTGGMVIEHDSGTVALDVSGAGVGGGQVAKLRNGLDTVSIGVEIDEILGALIKIVGLPTSSAGLPANTVYNSTGTLKIT